MLFRLLIQLTILLVFLSGCNSNSNSTSSQIETKRYSTLSVPFRENGYSNLQTQLISSKEAYDSFVKSVATQDNWNDKNSFISALSSSAIDFSSSNLILFRVTESSGSNILTPKEPQYSGENFTVKIERVVPDIGTTDMAYYILAYLVDKKTQTINFYKGDEFTSISNQLEHNLKCDSTYAPICASKQVQCITTPCNPIPQTYMNQCMFDIDSDVKLLFNAKCPSSSDIVPENCKRWFDGCNSCTIFETGLMACTEMYCYMPSGKAKCTLY